MDGGGGGSPVQPPTASSNSQATYTPHATRKGDVWDLFQMFDTDHSGNIDAGEVKDLCTKLGVALSQEEFEGALAAMDDDGSGVGRGPLCSNEWAPDVSVCVRAC